LASLSTARYLNQHSQLRVCANSADEETDSTSSNNLRFTSLRRTHHSRPPVHLKSPRSASLPL